MQPVALATILGVSVITLAACGRTPTNSLNAADPSPEAPEVATLEADEPTGTARAVTAAETQPDAGELRRREAELAQREKELRVQQDELRRERERLEAGRGGGPVITDEQGSIDADQATAPTSGSSSIRKEPTSPIVVPPGTPLEIELSANVNTKIARVGDRIEGRLASDLVVGDRRAAMAGAAVAGRVTELVPDGDQSGGVSALVLTFDSLQAANGATIPIVARYRTLTSLDGLAMAPRPAGDVIIRAGTAVTAQTETSFSLY